MKKHQLLTLKTYINKPKALCKSPVQSAPTNPTIQKAKTHRQTGHSEREVQSSKVHNSSSFVSKEAPQGDDIMRILIKSTDAAVDAFKRGSYPLALKMLQNVEQDLEEEAEEGKIIDRNLIIVCLYNTACTYQAMWSLDECLKYIDAVIYNLKESLTQDHPKSPERTVRSPKRPKSRLDKQEQSNSNANRAVKLRKLNFLLRVYLQQSAVLSQLQKHQESLDVAQEAQNTLNLIVSECTYACDDLKSNSLSPGKQKSKELTSSCLSATTASFHIGVNPGSVREPKSFFKDEVSYTRSIVEHAIPFLKDFKKTSNFFTTASLQEVLIRAKKSLAEWKVTSDNKDRSSYTAISKGSAFLQDSVRFEDRSLLGVQHTTDWLDTFNIDCIMQMDPVKHKDYAQTRDVANDLSREALQEKAIYQSVIYFITATEAQFIDSTRTLSNKSSGQKIKKGLVYKPPKELPNAESYHLQAIEMACRFIHGPCAYIEHLASIYLKYYSQGAKQNVTPYTQADQEAIHVQHTYKNTSAGASGKKEDETPKTVRTAKTARSRNYEIEISDNNKSAEMTKRIDKPVNLDYMMSPVTMIKDVSSRAHKDDQSKKKMLGLKLKRIGEGSQSLYNNQSAVHRTSPQRILSDRNSHKRVTESFKRSSRSNSPNQNKTVRYVTKQSSPLSFISNTSFTSKILKKSDKQTNKPKIYTGISQKDQKQVPKLAMSKIVKGMKDHSIMERLKASQYLIKEKNVTTDKSTNSLKVKILEIQNKHKKSRPEHSEPKKLIQRINETQHTKMRFNTNEDENGDVEHFNAEMESDCIVFAPEMDFSSFTGKEDMQKDPNFRESLNSAESLQRGSSRLEDITNLSESSKSFSPLKENRNSSKLDKLEKKVREQAIHNRRNQLDQYYNENTVLRNGRVSLESLD